MFIYVKDKDSGIDHFLYPCVIQTDYKTFIKCHLPGDFFAVITWSNCPFYIDKNNNISIEDGKISFNRSSLFSSNDHTYTLDCAKILDHMLESSRLALEKKMNEIKIGGN